MGRYALTVQTSISTSLTLTLASPPAGYPAGRAGAAPPVCLSLS